MQLEQAVQRRPAEHARVGEVPPLTAHFPDALVGLAPPFTDQLAQLDERLLCAAVEGTAAAHQVRGGADHLSVEIQLPLGGRLVADADRSGAAVTFEVGQFPLAHRRAAVDVVQHVQLGPRSAGRIQKPADERLCLLAVAEPEESARGEGSVAQPAEAIVPVQIASQALGQGGGGSGEDRAGRGVGEELEHQCAAHHLVAVRPAVGGAGRPVQPEPERRIERGPAVLGGRQHGRAARRQRQAEVDALTGAQADPPACSGCRRFERRLRAQRQQARAATHPQPQPTRAGEHAAFSRVVRPGIEVHLQLDLAAGALRDA